MSSPPSLTCTQVDFVSGDVDALASHMQHCARARGRWFEIRSTLQRLRSIAAGRVVTIACAAAVLGIGLFALA